MNHRSRRVLLTAGGLLAAGIAQAQSFETYPNRPVRAIVPFGPGGATDFVARIVVPRLSQELGQNVVIENRSGAAGNIGVELASRALPDGYTILIGNVGTMAINPTVFPKFHVSPARDFVGVSILSDLTLGVVVHPSVPVATLKEFITFAKARQGQLNYSSTGPSSAARLSFAFMANKAGLKIGHIPYKDGGGAATMAALTGEVEVTMQAVSSFLPHVKTGRLRALGVVAVDRIPQLPAIPTLAESGFPELTLGSWHGILVPAGTPRPIVDKLHAAVLRVMKDPDLNARFRAGAAAALTSKSPEDFAAFMKAQTAFWAALVKGLGAVEG